MTNNSIIEKISKRKLGERFFYLVLASLIGALAFNIFYKPYNVIPTGSTGFAFLLTKYIRIDVALMTFIVNFILFLLGYIVYDRKYAIKFLLITIIYPIFLYATVPLTNKINLGSTSLFLIMIIGGALSGISSGLIRKYNFTPGGFSVIFDILHDKFHISIGTASAIINGMTIIFSGFTFGVSSAMYAIIAMILSSYTMDKIIIGISNNKVFYIVTRHPDIIRDCILDKFHYNVTILKTKNSTNKKVLMCVLPTIEHLKLKDAIKKIDPDAFFLVVDTYETSVKENCKNM